MTSGSFRLDGEEVQGLDDAALTFAPPQHAGLCVPVHHLLPAFSALENVTLPALMAEGRVSTAHRDHAAQPARRRGPGPGHEQAPGRAVGRHAAARGHCACAGHEPAAGAGR